MNRPKIRLALLLPSAFVFCLILLMLTIDFIIRIDSPGQLGEYAVLQKIFLVASLTFITTLSYISWPSRWNVLAHAQLAFCIVSIWLPLMVLNVEEQFPIIVYNKYASVIIFGAIVCCVGALIGKSLALQKIARTSRQLQASLPLLLTHTLDSEDTTRRRAVVVTVFSALLLCACFAIMGFIPAFAENPLMAKFFKGVYAEPYSRVSIPYRMSTTILALLVGIVMAYAWIDRRVSLLLVATFAVTLMLLTLQRGPAAASILTVVGLIAASRPGKIRMGVYFFALLIVYAGGSALYWILGLFGFSALTYSDGNIAEQIAAGAPDISDHLTFLNAWLASPETTLGRTFFGGLVPGNFEWNPGVWTLMVSSPAADITNISSGGFRIPVPLWGLVSFGTLWSVLIVCLVHGILVGYTSRIARQKIEGKNLKAATIETAYFGAVLGVFGQLYAVSYVDAIALVAAYLVLRKGIVNINRDEVRYL